MFGVRVRECSNVFQGVLQCLGLGSGSAPMFVRVRECSNVWG